MKTAIEQLMIALYEGGYLRGNGNEMDDILGKYKEMEKQQIIDAYDKNKMGRVNYGEKYYNETYGSKGSDDKKEPKDIVLGYKTSLEAQMLDSQLPQTEIADDEIKYAAYKDKNVNMGMEPESAFIDGAKWYREQLKSKQ